MKPEQHSLSALVIIIIMGCAPWVLSAQTAVDEESPWPRVRTLNGNTATLYLPEVERWTSNSFTARAVVELKPDKAKSSMLGVVWFDAHGSVDRSSRLVTLDRFELTKARFPESTDNGSNALQILRQLIPSGARTVSLDYLVTALGFAQASARQGARGLKSDAPAIIWVTNRTVLVVLDGEPALRPVPNSKLQRVINTPALLAQDPANGDYFLAGGGRWFTARSLEGPWALCQTLPAEMATLNPGTGLSATPDDLPPPRIIVRTSPAELVTTSGLPDYRPIRGTALQYAADTDSQLFFYNTDREAYLLLSGRWYKAKSLLGPWSHVAPHELPADFARIPPNSPQGVVLASVPDTPQADLAVLANSVPTTATVDRKTATLELAYDGEPQFKPIEGTAMTYAVNAQKPVILSGASYYALDNGVWFVAASAKGPWAVATTVPEEIYTIPPSSPVYYATFARVYDSSDDEVEVGYAPGYTGTYEDEGTVVYGTGYDYQPWCGNDYYGWGWTWGYSYLYVPWYSWWVWRPWWNPPGGLRAALIENIYDRWQGRNGVIHHDGPVPGAGTVNAQQAASALKARAANFSGYPALYGRYQGWSAWTPWASWTPWVPPGNTLVVNPYSRPQSSTAPGTIPRGAQLLSSVRQSPGAGRDLYASPDGNVYRRQNDAWYRRDPGGAWSYYAPTQGRIQRENLAGGAQTAAGGGYVYRPMAGAARQALANRVPNTGARPEAQQVAALERQYYARTLAQLRTQNWRAGAAVRRGGGRRR
jgi:hypothetical protein